MKKHILFLLLLPGGDILYAMQNESLAIHSASLVNIKNNVVQGEIDRNIFLKLSDKSTYELAREHAQQCEAIKKQWLAGTESFGTRSNPYVVPFKNEDILNFENYIKMILAKKDREVRNALGALDLGKIAKIINASKAFECTSVRGFAEREFVLRMKEDEDQIKNFVEKQEFVASFGFDADEEKTLGCRLLDSSDDTTRTLNAIRSFLYSDLRGKGPVQRLMFNVSNDYFLAIGVSDAKQKIAEGTGFCDIWSIDGEMIYWIADVDPIHSCAFLICPTIATLTAERLTLRNIINNKEISKQEIGKDAEHSGKKFTAMSISPDFSLIALGLGDSVIIVDMRQKKITKTLRASKNEGDLGDTAHLLFSPDNLKLIELRSTGLIRFWDIKTESVKLGEEHKKPIVKFDFSKYGTLRTVDQDGLLCEWTQEGTFKEKWTDLTQQKDELEDIKPLCFDNSGSKLVFTKAGGSDASVFDLGKGNMPKGIKKKFEIKKGVFLEGCYHPDDETIATLVKDGEDYGIILWESNSGNKRAYLDCEKQSVRGLCFSPDGGILASCLKDGRIRLWHYCNKDIEVYLQKSVNLSQALLLLLFERSKKDKGSFDISKVEHLKKIYDSINPLLKKLLK